MEFPDFFPINCPPSNAHSCSGTIYRLILEKKQKPIHRKHFLSQREKQPNKKWHPTRSECALCGVSVVSAFSDAIKLRTILKMRIPAFKTKGIFIAKGTLTGNFGKMIVAPDEEDAIDSHYEWWLPKGEDPSSQFEYCDIGEQQ